MENVKVRLGDILLQAGLISDSQLNEALAKQKILGKRLGQVLIDEGYISRNQLVQILGTQLGIETVDLSVSMVDPKIAKLIPENVARRHGVIPVRVTNGFLILAMQDPLDRIALQDVNLLAQMPVKPALAALEGINSVIDYVFSHDMVAKAANDYVQFQSGSVEGLDSEFLDVNSAPIVRMVNSVLETAVRSGASDIHIEPGTENMKVRIRIDGVLQDMLVTSTKPHNAVVSRIKIMSGLNISEKRLPQDGRIMVKVDMKDIDLRVSTMPTNHGEKIVMRILDRTGFMLGKEHLGLNQKNVQVFNRLISKPYGILLVTGPTGSGKTTTLYSMLSELNDKSKNIVTIEDPVEYDVEGVNQTQINVKAGLTFATGLRAFLRQDPDVIMLGEIRDGETAEIAVRAALTGHMVLSTMHTNNSAGAVARLVDMGIEPFLLSSSLIGVVAQRLVRKACTHCRTGYLADEREKRILGCQDIEELTLYRAKGCDYCSKTGYKGRVGVFEVFEVTKELRLAIDERLPTELLTEKALEQGMVTLSQDARSKVLDGTTTLDEYLRVTFSY